jgi:hypothetical protein
MFLHVAHTQAMERGRAWCGANVQGPHIVGLENMLYHAKDPKAGAVCEACVEAILDRIDDAVRRIQVEKSKGGASC